MLSSGLGVLINLAEDTTGLRGRLAAAPVAHRASDGTTGEQPPTLVLLLCGLLSRTAQ